MNFTHSGGKDKAAMFQDRLGITLENKHILEAALLNSLVENEATASEEDDVGARYNIFFEMETAAGKSFVLGCWIVLKGEEFPRLTTTYPISTKRAEKIWKH